MLYGFSSNANGMANESVIRIQARKFRFVPSEIQLRKGESAVLEITSEDFMHGFRLPSMGIEVDLPLGRTTQIRIQPKETGTFVFSCGSYCGPGHEAMTGRLIVRE
jgi:cytochrome c oxidase subunit 2